MNRTCSKSGCSAPDVTCTLGETKLEDCEHWVASTQQGEVATEEQNAASASDEYRFPWTGNVLGRDDLAYIAGSSKCRLVTMAGPAEAGKTSLLAAFYLLTARGITPDGVTFAGSLTLEGWENIACNLRWKSGNGPSFPPHTSSGNGRWPGLLHMTLKAGVHSCEFLAADAPGEWFSEWATSKNSTQADGANWLAQCSDVILVIADSQALSGAQRGIARKGLVDLIHRIGAEAKSRPVALVWAKCDVQVDAGMVETIKEAANKSLSGYAEFAVSMHPTEDAAGQNKGQGILELLDWILKAEPVYFLESSVCKEPERDLLHTFGER
jgi:hypothetical protein